jgi:hypothetical protein
MKLITTILLLTILVSLAWSQDMQVPIEQQVPLMIKILNFDRNLQRHAQKQIMVAVLYQKKFRKSLDAKNRFEDVVGKLSLTKIDSMPIKFMSVDIGEDTDLAANIDRNYVNVVYLTPVKAFNVDDIVKICRQRQITSFTGIGDYVNTGIAIGFGIKGDKPQIIINLPAAKAEGANFNSQLLKLAKVIE